MSGRAGASLARCVGLPLDRFLFEFNRVYVFNRWPGTAAGGIGTLFPVRTARARAHKLKLVGSPIVFLGGLTAEAFDFRGRLWSWGVCRGKPAVTILPPVGLYDNFKIRKLVESTLASALELAAGR